MKSNVLLCILCICSVFGLYGQVNFTALDFNAIPPYNHHFLYGVNLGYYGDSWNDQALADIAAGNAAKNVPGVGSKSLRPPLPGYFVDYYGYNIRVNEFEYFRSLGIQHNTIMLGWPADGERENVSYDCSESSKMFANMYLPIWDDGTDGTPYNDENYYAKYVYNIVSLYKDYTKFWEIMNEPDFDVMSQAWLGPDQPGNWWTNDPTPCALLNMRAPIQTYVRMLRISYEIIKTLDPTAFVCTGGIGYASFLDAVLRNTDNPDGGKISPEYPHTGGAYFDMLSFHSYPMYKLGLWSNALNGFEYKRHSDAAIDIYLKDRNELDEVLKKHHFDGVTFPEKKWICTESNISRIQSESFIGSDTAQLNYVMKVQIISQQNKILQHYLFVLGEPHPKSGSQDPFDFMALYQSLTNNGPLKNEGQYNVEYTLAGRGLRTLSENLLEYQYNESVTNALNISEQVAGAAFVSQVGNNAFVLWAKTTTDESEYASAEYILPDSIFQANDHVMIDWQGNETPLTTNRIMLNATPLIIKQSDYILPVNGSKEEPVKTERDYRIRLFPNPATTETRIAFSLLKRETVTVKMYSSAGTLVQVFASGKTYPAGDHQIMLEPKRMPPGVYYIYFSSDYKQIMLPFIVQ